MKHGFVGSVGVILGAVIAIVIASSLIYTVSTQTNNTNTGATGATATMLNLIPLVYVVAIIGIPIGLMALYFG